MFCEIHHLEVLSKARPIGLSVYGTKALTCCIISAAICVLQLFWHNDMPDIHANHHCCGCLLSMCTQLIHLCWTQVASFTATAVAAERALGAKLPMASSQKQAEQLLQETAEAQQASLSLQGIHDLRGLLEAAARNRVLHPIHLDGVASSLEASPSHAPGYPSMPQTYPSRVMTSPGCCTTAHGLAISNAQKGGVLIFRLLQQSQKDWHRSKETPPSFPPCRI